MSAPSVKLQKRVLKPVEFAQETHEQARARVMVEICDCDLCKHAISSPNGIYCGKLKEHVNSVASCPYFNLESLEYKLYRRS